MHLGNPPFHYVAEMLVVYVVVLFADRSLSSFPQLILPVSTTNISSVLDVTQSDLNIHFDQLVI